MGAPDSNATASGERELTGEERALYDRQIRLWGADAQRKLSSGRVLVVGDIRSCLLQELAKNVVLAGIASITFACEGESNGDDGVGAGVGFLGTDGDTVREALRSMNPLVQVHTAPRARAAELVAEADVVCSVGGGVENDCVLSEACASRNTPFFAGRAAGFVGWVFLGLGAKYTYTPAGGPGGAESSEAFPTLRSALDAPWGKEVKRSKFAWHAVTALLRFHAANARMPGADEADVEKLRAVYAELVKQKSPAREAPQELLDGLAKCAHVELPALGAVVGGVWGREVVKVLSRKDAPLRNLFMFNSRTSIGVVEMSASQ